MSSFPLSPCVRYCRLRPSDDQADSQNGDIFFFKSVPKDGTKKNTLGTGVHGIAIATTVPGLRLSGRGQRIGILYRTRPTSDPQQVPGHSQLAGNVPSGVMPLIISPRRWPFAAVTDHDTGGNWKQQSFPHLFFFLTFYLAHLLAIVVDLKKRLIISPVSGACC